MLNLSMRSRFSRPCNAPAFPSTLSNFRKARAQTIVQRLAKKHQSMNHAARSLHQGCHALIMLYIVLFCRGRHRFSGRCPATPQGLQLSYRHADGTAVDLKDRNDFATGIEYFLTIGKVFKIEVGTSTSARGDQAAGDTNEIYNKINENDEATEVKSQDAISGTPAPSTEEKTAIFLRVSAMFPTIEAELVTTLLEDCGW